MRHNQRRRTAQILLSTALSLGLLQGVPVLASEEIDEIQENSSQTSFESFEGEENSTERTEDKNSDAVNDTGGESSFETDDPRESASDNNGQETSGQDFSSMDETTENAFESDDNDPQKMDDSNEVDDADELENEAAPKKESLPLYRLYNPNTGEHFYTVEAKERDGLVESGWRDEKTAWSVPKTGTPIYRLYNPNASDHHYTMDEKEKAALVQAGWVDEGVRFYSESVWGQPVWRLYNPNAKSGSHHYTLSKTERDELKKKGWRDEGSSFFAISPYTFWKDEKSGGIRAIDANGKDLIGRVKVHENIYQFGKDGLMITGWHMEENGGRRFYDEYGREYAGLCHVSGSWYYFEPKDSFAKVNGLYTHSDGRLFWFGEDGKAVSGRIFAFPKVGESDGNGKIAWSDCGWSNATSRHVLKARERELSLQIEALKADGGYHAGQSDPVLQDLIAEDDRIHTLLKGQETVGIHSVYNPNSGEHLYTGQEKEIASLVKAGWKDEGVRFQQPKESTKPIYRVYSPGSGDHHYTLDSTEVQALVRQGWKNEGTVFYSAEYSAIPVFRVYNPNAKVGSHHYTIDPRERDHLLSMGWRDEKEGFASVGLYSFVEEDTPAGRGTRIYDPDDNLLSGLVDVQGYRYYLDPTKSNCMLTGEQTIPYQGKNIKVRFDDNGRMIFGELKTDRGFIFYDLDSGEQVFNRFVQYGVPRRVSYFDGNGLRVKGRQTINGKAWLFNDQGMLVPDYADLEKKVNDLINARVRGGEQVAFALRVPGTDTAIVLNSRSQQSASVMKAFVMGAIHENYDLYASRVGKDRLEQQLSVMISISDNEAWKYLVSVLGGGSYGAGLGVLKAWNTAHGYTDTYMTGVPYGNFTSARDASKLLCDIQEGRLKHSAKMKALLQTQRVPGRMLQGIPPEARTGNKPGWVGGCENDTVLVDAPFGTYVVTLLCDRMQSSARAQALMGELSPMVYYWMKDNMNIGTSIPK